jgi:hypothetical protein
MHAGDTLERMPLDGSSALNALHDGIAGRIRLGCVAPLSFTEGERFADILPTALKRGVPLLRRLTTTT